MKKKKKFQISLALLSCLILSNSFSFYAQDCKTLLNDAKRMIREASCNKTDPNTFGVLMSDCVTKLATNQCTSEVNMLLNYIQELAANPKLIDCGNKQICVQLAEFRDTKLLNLYNKAFEDFEKNKISQDYVEIISKVKKELLDDTKWQTSDIGRSIAVLSQYINLQCNLIQNVIETALPQLKTSRRFVKLTIDAISMGNNLNELFSGEVNNLALDKVLELYGPVGSAIKTVKDLVKDVNAIKENEEEFKVLRKELNIAIGKIDKEIKTYNLKISTNTKNFSDLKYIKDVIDQYLSTNCTSAKSRLN